METEIINLIFNYGMPSALVFYFIFKLEKTLNKNTEAINKLTEIIFQTHFKK